MAANGTPATPVASTHLFHYRSLRDAARSLMRDRARARARRRSAVPAARVRRLRRAARASRSGSSTRAARWRCACGRTRPRWRAFKERLADRACLARGHRRVLRGPDAPVPHPRQLPRARAAGRPSRAAPRRRTRGDVDVREHRAAQPVVLLARDPPRDAGAAALPGSDRGHRGTGAHVSRRDDVHHLGAAGGARSTSPTASRRTRQIVKEVRADRPPDRLDVHPLPSRTRRGRGRHSSWPVRYVSAGFADPASDDGVRADAELRRRARAPGPAAATPPRPASRRPTA